MRCAGTREFQVIVTPAVIVEVVVAVQGAVVAFRSQGSKAAVSSVVKGPCARQLVPRVATAEQNHCQARDKHQGGEISFHHR